MIFCYTIISLLCVFFLFEIFYYFDYACLLCIVFGMREIIRINYQVVKTKNLFQLQIKNRKWKDRDSKNSRC